MKTKNQSHLSNYLAYCTAQKKLDSKTIKSYMIDLNQFLCFIEDTDVKELSIPILESYISSLHAHYKPKTVKRKLASTKAFFHYLEYKEILEKNPFDKLHIRFREPILLPKTIPLHSIESILATIYHEHQTARTPYQRRNALRDVAVIEFLFATGIRISELCNLTPNEVNLYEGSILIYGKGSKERRIHIGNEDVLDILKEYEKEYHKEIVSCNHFFASQSGKPLSGQSVRRMINKYTSVASIEQHITPHMFRHTFATALLEEDVDIRYIQEMLGHSSINVTEIYTHVTLAKQREILTNKHPRKKMRIEG
jgi:integrase/recombinase XerD